jgi:hypothetical protein
MDKRILARFMHSTYEEKSKLYKWKTQEKCQVDFDKLPEENQKVILSVAEEVINLFEGKIK